jgi:hypothetical protein
MPSVMSTRARTHCTHMFAAFGVIAVPHSQHKLQYTPAYKQ